jgi:hypothetical protein
MVFVNTALYLEKFSMYRLIFKKTGVALPPLFEQ